MKIFVYNYREFDEAEYFEKFSKEYHVELGICKEAPSLENAYLVKGYEYVSIITTKIDRPLLEKFREFGVKMISTRTVGYDHIDLEAARQLGIRVSNVSYSPECVADYTMMLILMSIRKMKRIMQRAEINDFSLPGIQGRELPNFTIGVLGTGRIGQAVIRDLHGFGCKIYAYDKYENEAVKQLKGGTEEEIYTTVMDLNVDAYIPNSYIPNEYQKLDIYKRIAGIEDEEEMDDMLEELIDRFGDVPRKVQQLLQIAGLKALAHSAYVTAVEQKGEEFRFTMYEKAKVNPQKIPPLIQSYRGNLVFKAEAVPYFVYYKKGRNKKEKDETVLELVKKLLNDIKSLLEEKKDVIMK